MSLLMLLGARTAVAAGEVTHVGSQGDVDNGTGGTTLTVNVPTGVQEDDLLLFGWRMRSGATFPSGWTSLLTAFNNHAFGYRWATASEPASYSFVQGASGRQVAIIAAYRGVNLTTPFVDDDFTGTTAAPAVTSVASGRVWWWWDASAQGTLLVPDAGIVSNAFAIGASTVSSRPNIAVGDAATSGATTATPTTTATSAFAAAVSLRPA